jgi:hypothetical protein
LRVENGGLDETRTTLLAQAIAVAADGDDVAVMKQPIEDGGGDDGIAEDGTPLADRAVGGDQQAAAISGFVRSIGLPSLKVPPGETRLWIDPGWGAKIRGLP